MMRAACWAALALCFCAPAWAAGWAIVDDHDPLGKPMHHAAAVTNARGDQLAVFADRLDNGWLRFTLAPTSGDRIADGSLPTLTIDQSPPYEPSVMRSQEEHPVADLHFYRQEATSVAFFVLYAGDQRLRLGHFDRLMHGKRAWLQYLRPDGTTVRAEFSLEGAGAAIARVLGVTVDQAPALLARAQARERVEAAASKECRAHKLPDDRARLCSEYLLVCGVPDPSKRDAQEYVECFRHWRTAKPGEHPPL